MKKIAVSLSGILLVLMFSSLSIAENPAYVIAEKRLHSIKKSGQTLSEQELDKLLVAILSDEETSLKRRQILVAKILALGSQLFRRDMTINFGERRNFPPQTKVLMEKLETAPSSSYLGKYNFRKSTWGMSVDEVKSSETLDAVRDDGSILAYKTNVISKDVFIVYFFIENQLVRSRYLLAQKHSNRNAFITDYNDFKEILSKKYGKPKESGKHWINDLYKKDRSEWGMAISVGHLVYLSEWDTKDTEITNILHGDNFDITLSVEYTSKTLKKLEKKAQEEQALGAF